MTKEYTKVEREMVVRTLRAAKRVLWDGIGRCPPGKEKYICHAATRADPSVGGPLVVALVEGRLRGNYALSTWLLSQGVPNRQMTIQRLQAHRHAWVDLLIEEFSK